MHRIVLLLAGLAAAQVAPWGLPPSAEFANRYEGILPRQVANPDFELLSFTAGRVAFGATDLLQVDFFLPGAPGPVLIRAQELRDDKYYRMLSKPAAWRPDAWNSFRPWPVSDVIGPQGVSPENIGVVVHLGDAGDASTTIAPAFVHAGSGRTPAARYTIVFRTRSTLREVEYVLRRADTGATVWSGAADGDFIRGTPVYIDVPAASLEDGRFVLELTCVPVSAAARRLERQFTFSHISSQGVGAP